MIGEVEGGGGGGGGGGDRRGRANRESKLEKNITVKREDWKEGRKEDKGERK